MPGDITRLDLRQRRRSTLAYTVGFAGYAILVVALYPNFRHDQALAELTQGNDKLSALFGATGSLTSPEGWMNANLYALLAAHFPEDAEQPCMVLHELAHAYHFLVLGEKNPEIAAAYRQAVESGSYESVDYAGGGKRRAYALVNEKEYFAEISEAYFGRNDFYPFTRADLQRHDPVGYELLRRLWGRVENRESVALTSDKR